MSTANLTDHEAASQSAITESVVSPDLKLLESKSIASLEDALSSVRELSAARSAAKLSAARLSGVARELRELIKVMSVYGC